MRDDIIINRTWASYEAGWGFQYVICSVVFRISPVLVWFMSRDFLMDWIRRLIRIIFRLRQWQPPAYNYLLPLECSDIFVRDPAKIANFICNFKELLDCCSCCLVFVVLRHQWSSVNDHLVTRPTLFLYNSWTFCTSHFRTRRLQDTVYAELVNIHSTVR